MRLNHRQLLKLCARRRDQIVRDRYDHFRQNIQPAVHEQIERPVDRARQTIFDRRENVIRKTVVDRAERRFERGARHERNLLAEEFYGGLLAEGATLPLKCHARVFPHFHFRAGLFAAGARSASSRQNRAAAACESIRRVSPGRFSRWSQSPAGRDSDSSCAKEFPARAPGREARRLRRPSACRPRERAQCGDSEGAAGPCQSRRFCLASR